MLEIQQSLALKSAAAPHCHLADGVTAHVQTFKEIGLLSVFGKAKQ